MVKKHTLSKYLLCGAAASALALVPLQAKADVAMAATTATAAPTALSGTIEKYLVDRSGYVTALKLKDSSGASQIIQFPANRAGWIYANFPTGATADLWVVPTNHKSKWKAVGAGTETPNVWWRVIETSDSDWLTAEPYIEIGAREVTVSGTFRGFVYNNIGEVVAFRMFTPDGGKVLVRVPPQVRQVAPGYEGSRGIAPAFHGANVVVVGTPEAPRKGGVTAYNQYIAGNSISINGITVGAIGFQANPSKRHKKYWDYEPVTAG